MLTLEQFKAARATLQGVIRTTSLIHSPALSKACGNQVYLKPVISAAPIPPPATTPRGWPMPPRRRGSPPPS